MIETRKSQFLESDPRFLSFYIKEAEVGKAQAAQELGLTVEEVCWIWEEEVEQGIRDLHALEQRLKRILRKHDPTPRERRRFKESKKD